MNVKVTRTVRPHRRALIVSLILSVLLHATAALILLLTTPPQEQQRFRVRFMPLSLLQPQRFRPIHVRSRAIPEVQMERITPELRGPTILSIPPVDLPGVTLPKVQMPPTVPPGEEIAMGIGAKPPEFEIGPAKVIPPGELYAVREEPFDPTLELLRLEDIERTGLKSFVVIDREDKRKIVGYFHITRLGGNREDMNLTRFASDLSRRTNIQVKPEDRSVSLRSGEILQAPMLFLGPNISGQDTVRGVGTDTLRYIEGVKKQDIEFIVEYLLKGGFVVIPQMEFYEQLRRYTAKTHPGRFVFFDLPPDHPIFHSFYDINIQSFYDLVRSLGLRMEAPLRDQFPIPFRGIEIDERLTGLAPFSVPNPADSALYIPMTKLATNVVTFALTQPGGLGYAVFQPSRPERFYEHETNALLALVKGSNADALRLNELEVFLGEELLNRPHSSAEGEHDALVFHNLRGGKRQLRLRYGAQQKEIEVFLKGDRVATVTFGINRFLWMSRLWARIEGADEPYANWQARHAHLRVEHVGGTNRVTMESVPSTGTR